MKMKGILKKKEKKKKYCTTHDDLTQNARSRVSFILARLRCKTLSADVKYIVQP